MRDISLITELFNTLHTNDNGWSIDKAVRLDKRNPAKPRMLKVTLKNLNNKSLIMKNASKLRKLHEDNKFKKVYINPDRTPAQSRRSKNLYSTLKTKIQEHPEFHWVIVRGVVIPREGRDNQNQQ